MSLRHLLVVLAIAIGLTVLFWGPLWQGHGLIGGDLYTYFFPQKLVYAEQSRDGDVPLWNDLVGFGYPMLAESQAGVFYPPNPLLYRQFDVNTAYNINQLAHYVLAFVFTWLLLRRLQLSVTAATLGAIVFVYGWFPPRLCLEWAIIGGVYFPLALWCVESFLQSGRWRWLILLALSQGMHLLAGHFNLAFITQLTCGAYALLRLFLSDNEETIAKDIGGARFKSLGLILAAVVCGFALAAVQLLPTWELKQLSQRDDLGGAHDPGYGHIPPWYLSQIVAPWLWYPADIDPDQALQQIRTWTIPSSTNKVEAHLYFGTVPLLLILYRFVSAMMGTPLRRRHRIWFWLGLAAMIYATGWLLILTRYVPGFSFFMGPGRYGIVTTFAAVVLAAAGLDQLLEKPRFRFRSLLVGLVIGLTVTELFWVSRRVTYAVMVEDPPIQHVEESTVRSLLDDYEAARGPEYKARMLAPGPNWATLTGHAAYPQYLGIGPADYFDPALMMPEPAQDQSPAERSAARSAQRDWLREGAFTHVLSMDPLDLNEWPETRLVWQGIDRLLNPVYARYYEPIYLYELTDAQPRIRFEDAGGSQIDGAVTIEQADSNRLELLVTSETGGELIWSELAYPGWTAYVAGDRGTQTIETADGLFRTLPLPAGNAAVVWEYDPSSYERGAQISTLSVVLLLIVCGHRLLRRRERTGDESSLR